MRYPEQCTCGCTDFDIVEEVVEEKLTVVKEHQRRRVVRRKTGRCRRCNKRTTARSLPAPFARSKATCDWLVWLVVHKYVLLLPLDRIRDLLRLHRPVFLRTTRRRGCSLTTVSFSSTTSSTMSNAVQPQGHRSE